MCKLKFAMHFFDWRNVILNQIYPDLTCNFPESIDDNMQLMDITIKTMLIWHLMILNQLKS